MTTMTTIAIGHCGFFLTPQPEPPSEANRTPAAIAAWEAELEALRARKRYHHHAHERADDCVRFSPWRGNKAFMNRSLQDVREIVREFDLSR